MITNDPFNLAIATLTCDSCGKSTEALRAGNGIVRPAGWLRLCWVPGVLHPVRKDDLHFCSPVCRNGHREPEIAAADPASAEMP